MKNRLKYLMEKALPRFKHIIDLLNPELVRWVEYKGFTLPTGFTDEVTDEVVFHFKSGNEIWFDCRVNIDGVGINVDESYFHTSYDYIYDYFRDIKEESLQESVK